jgi:hypothetical protein
LRIVEVLNAFGDSPKVLGLSTYYVFYDVSSGDYRQQIAICKIFIDSFDVTLDEM